MQKGQTKLSLLLLSPKTNNYETKKGEEPANCEQAHRHESTAWKRGIAPKPQKHSCRRTCKKED